MRWVSLVIVLVAVPAWADHDMLRFGLEPGRMRGGALFSSEYTSYERTSADDPAERWSVDTRIILLRYTVAVSYRPTERVRVSVSVANEELDFYRADRADEDDAITFAEQTAQLRLSWDPTPNVRLELAAGYTWEREIYEDDDDNDLDIDPGFFGTAGLTVRF